MLGPMLTLGAARLARRAGRRRRRAAASGPARRRPRARRAGGDRPARWRAHAPGGGRRPRRGRRPGARAPRGRRQRSGVDRGLGAGGEGWVLMAAPALAVPGQAGQGEAAYARRPGATARPADRRARSGHARASAVVLRPEDERECCLLIDDLVVDRQHAPPRDRRRSVPRRRCGARHRSRRRRDRRAARLVLPRPAQRCQQPDRGAGLPLGRRPLRVADATGCPSARAAPPSSSATAMAFRATKRPSSAAPLSTCCSGSASITTR